MKFYIAVVSLIFLFGCKADVNDFLYESRIVSGYQKASILDKPLFINFSCYGCMGYNEFNKDLLGSKQIQKVLNENYISVIAIVDDQKGIETVDTLGIDKLKLSRKCQKDIREARNVGNINAAIQIDMFKNYSQPLYAIINARTGEIINKFGFVNRNREKFLTELKEGLEFFNHISENVKIKQHEVIDFDNILSFKVDPKLKEINFYHLDKLSKPIGSLGNLKNIVESGDKKLIFGMNGGMFDKALNPQGLFVQNGIIKNELDTSSSGYGNFYLMPNGVFQIDNNNEANIISTKEYYRSTNVKHATQSGPLLIHNGKINSKLTKGSKNLHIRNGVGILPNGSVLFAMSKNKINFYDFASFFKENGCKNALYLDGFVSRTYLPSKNNLQLDGNFGVMIGIEE